MTTRSLAFLNIVLSLALMAFGAFLHDAKIAKDCPEWPLCSGDFADVKVIYFHRLLAFSLVVTSFLQSFRLKKIDYEKSKWAHVFFGLVLLQAALGALTAVLNLPSMISGIHLLISLVAIVIALAHHHLFEKDVEVQGATFKAWFKDGLLFVLILLFFQVLLGGLLRHTGAASSCGLGVQSVLVCHESVTGYVGFTPLTQAASLHMLHRGVGLLIAALTIPILFLCLLNLRELGGATAAKARNTALLVAVLLLIQIYSGFYNIASELAIHATVFHFFVASLLLSFVLKLRLYVIDIEQTLSEREVHSFFSDVLELFKPKLAGLVMVTMLIGALLVPGKIQFFDLFYSSFLIFMVVASATTLNCWMEKDVDALMERTKNRAIPAGRLAPKTALVIGLGMAFVSFPLLYFYVNPLTALLGLIAHLMYLLAYTPLKKYSAAALFVGAVPGALPPVMGWTTLTGRMDIEAWCLFAILFVWQLPHFLAISVYYRGDYEAAGLKVYARESNFNKIRRDIFIYTTILLAVSLAPVRWADFSQTYRLSATILGSLFLAQSVYGFFIQKNDLAARRWARQYFFGSIIYLPLLLASMLFFR